MRKESINADMELIAKSLQSCGPVENMVIVLTKESSLEDYRAALKNRFPNQSFIIQTDAEIRSE